MNINKFTQKSIEAVQTMEKVAYDYGNQEVGQLHLLYSMLTQEDGLIGKLITKMQIQLPYVIERTEEELRKLPKVSGNANHYISNGLNQVLIHGEDEAKAMSDEYVSLEHIFLALIKYAEGGTKNILLLENVSYKRCQQ